MSNYQTRFRYFYQCFLIVFVYPTSMTNVVLWWQCSEVFWVWTGGGGCTMLVCSWSCKGVWSPACITRFLPTINACYCVVAFNWWRVHLGWENKAKTYYCVLVTTMPLWCGCAVLRWWVEWCYWCAMLVWCGGSVWFVECRMRGRGLGLECICT